MRTFVECGHRGCCEKVAVWFEWATGENRGRWRKIKWHGLRRIDMTALHTVGWTARVLPKGRSVTFRCPKHSRNKTGGVR